MKKWMQAAAAAVTAFALLSGGLSALPGGFSPADTAVTAEAVVASAQIEGDTLVLRGKVTRSMILMMSDMPEIKRVVAAEGTVLPDDCSYLFADKGDTSGSSRMAPFFNAVSIDLSKADTSRVRNMEGMFYHGYAKTLDLSGFDVSAVTNMKDMFKGCGKLETVYATENWNLENASGTDEMFLDSSKLVGGNGTQYDANHTGAEYARIDRDGENGYFTLTPITQVSLSLTSDLGLNFYVNGANSDNKNDYAVVFSGKCEENGRQVKLNGKQDLCYATANVSADHMDEVITADLYKVTGSEGEMEKIYTSSYSVNDYLANAKPEEDWSAEKKAAFEKLVQTVKTYGQVSRAYFTDGDVSGIEVPVYTAADLEDMGQKPDFDSSDAAISLVLNSRMAVRLYIDGLNVGDQAANGKKAVAGKDGRACFEFTGVSPVFMNMHPTLKYDDVLYQFSPLSWCWRVLDADGGAPKNAAMANILVSYYQDANAFKSAV